MKKIKANRKMIIGVIIGIIISGVTSYAVAATLINSQDVVYDDKTSGLGVNNVQSAIDKTCSNIDTRLSEIEDNLYKVQNMYKIQNFTSSKTMAYTGVSITLPSNSYCAITVGALWTVGAPLKILLSYSPTVKTQSVAFLGGNNDLDAGHISVSHITLTGNSQTFYVWAQYTNVGSNQVEVSGFCATKIKQ